MVEFIAKEPIDLGAKAGLQAWQIVGTGNSENHAVIDKNLKGVSVICNVFVLGMCMWLMFRLFQNIRESKSNSQKRKIPLLNWSLIFIFCFLLNSLLLVFVPFWPSVYSLTDLAQQVVMFVNVWVFFKHWDTNLDLYVVNRFMLMLKTKSRSNKLTYMARVMNLASKYQRSFLLKYH